MFLENDPGFRFVGQASSAEDAVELIDSHRPDVVVLDLWLGGNDGIELVKRLHALAPKVGLLCYSMTDEALFGVKALRAGARGFISKQEPLEEVARALRLIHSGGRYMSTRLQRLAFDRVLDGAPVEETLSNRELQILRLIGMAESNPTIAEALSVSIKTVSAHREALKRKLGLRTSSELVRHAVLLVQTRFFGQT